MRNGKLLHLWESLRTSFWFVPTVMTVGAVILATTLLKVGDGMAGDWLGDIAWVHARSAAGARDLLRVVAGSMITIAGITFSIVVVALQLASQQLGPRQLRNFMRDLGNQITLGTYIATFVYCLLVMRTIDENDTATPRLAVVVALLLALVSLGVLIYFIHHAAASMQAPNVIANLSRELRDTVDRLYPEMLGTGAPSEDTGAVPDAGGFAAVHSERSGYLQRVDDEGLMKVARNADVVVRLDRRPGQFHAEGERILGVYPRERCTPELVADIRRQLIVGSQRTPEQDVEFVIERLVEIALRALSTSRNDVSTAVAAVDHLSAGLVRVAGRRIPSPLRRDGDGRLRVIAPGSDLARMIDRAFSDLLDVRPDLAAVRSAMEIALHRVSGALPAHDDAAHDVVRRCLWRARGDRKDVRLRTSA